MAIAELTGALAEMPRRLERLRKSGLKKLSRTDEDARFPRRRGENLLLGYSVEIAVSDDQFVVAQRVTQNVTGNKSLEPIVDRVKQRCGRPPDAAGRALSFGRRRSEDFTPAGLGFGFRLWSFFGFLAAFVFASHA